MRIISKNKQKAVIYYNNEFYLVSESPEEALIFKCNASGEVSNYYEVGGDKNTTLNEVLSDFSSYLYIQEKK